MKKIMSLIVGALVSVSAIAKEPGKGSASTGLAVVKKNATTFNILYQSESTSSVVVSILDKQGNKIFSEHIKHTDGFIRPYNFEELNEGEYTVAVEDANGVQKEIIKYRSEPAAKAANIIRLANDRYLLTVKGDMVRGKISIKVYEGSKVLHIQTKEVSGDFGQVFRLKDFSDTASFEVLDSKGNIIN